jgi:hypothetical protein
MAEPYSEKKVRPYSKPTLTVYGKVQELTKANFTTGGQDNGTDARLRTQVP